MVGDDYYQKAFGDVPNPTLLNMDENFARVPRTLRGLFYAILADPGDRAAYCALKDWLEAEISLPDVVTLPDGTKIPAGQGLPWVRWDMGRVGLETNTAMALWQALAGGQGFYTDAAGRMSIADIARLSWGELVAIKGIKGARAQEVRYWLGSMGLALRDEEVTTRPKVPVDDDFDPEDWATKSGRGRPGDNDGPYWR